MPFLRHFFYKPREFATCSQQVTAIACVSLDLTSNRLLNGWGRAAMSHNTGTRGRMIGKAAALAAVIVALALTATGTAAWAQTNIVIDNTTDDTAAGHCSLREGINSATGASGTGTCATGSGPFTITFDPSIAGQTIALTSTLPTITNGTTLTITGPLHRHPA
jgi:hypothetical protein